MYLVQNRFQYQKNMKYTNCIHISCIKAINNGELPVSFSLVVVHDAQNTGQSYVSRALQINSSPQGWMARNTKPVTLAEKGWVITMKKISIILLSAVLVFSMAACNGGKEKADNQTEKQTESVKPTEEAEIATEAVTEVTTEAGSEETDKDIADAKDSEEKTDKADNRSADNETASKQEEKSEQNDEPEKKAPASGNKEAGGNQSNAGNGGQTTDSPKDNVSNPQPVSVAYSPQNVVSLATAKCQAGGMITTAEFTEPFELWQYHAGRVQ